MAGFRTEAAQFARRIVCSEKYFASLKDRADAGILAPALEVLLLHYAYGKPVEQVAMTVTNEADLGSMSLEQLAARAEHVRTQLIMRHEEDQRLALELARQKLEAEARAQEQREEAARIAERESHNVFDVVARSGIH